MNELERTALNEILRAVTYIAEKVDANFVSARVGEAWKDESISRKIYLSNELLKEKNRLFKEWLASKDGSLNSDDYNLELVVKVSDDAHTTIAQEYKNKMKIVNK